MKRYRKKERVYQESEQRLELEREWNDEVMYRVMIGLSAAAVLAAVVLFLLPDLRAYVQDRPCILRQMTGLYCPGCGEQEQCFFFFTVRWERVSITTRQSAMRSYLPLPI